MAAKVSFESPIQSGDQSFDRVLKAGLPVAALFWGVGKIDQQLEAELAARARAEAGKLLIVKIKVEDNPELVRRFGIGADPTLVTFRDGLELGRVDNPTSADVRAYVEYVLGRGAKPAGKQPNRTATAPPVDGRPVAVTDASFASQVLQSAVPVVVDFWAPWCGPCRMVSPALERIAADMQAKVRIAKVNVDENPNLAQRYQVQGIPTLLFVRNGRIEDRIVGAMPEVPLRKRVEQFLKV